mmetsp:Transcript_26647/g.54939  ORF Transcript_26647/g.54939 Transcript_26647/m.54939 type:complete len:124 (-) Transcript_26647:1910-2281(-)
MNWTVEALSCICLNHFRPYLVSQLCTCFKLTNPKFACTYIIYHRHLRKKLKARALNSAYILFPCSVTKSEFCPIDELIFRKTPPTLDPAVRPAHSDLYFPLENPKPRHQKSNLHSLLPKVALE